MLTTAFVAMITLAQAPAKVPNDPDRDKEVMATTLDDLATYRGKDSPIDGVFSPNPLTLNPRPNRWDFKPADSADSSAQSKGWKALADANRPRLAEALEDVARRMKGPVVLFSAGSPRVRLYKGKDPSTLSPFHFFKAPVDATLPGYSNDGQMAIVLLAVPWSIHGCSGAYVLSGGKGAWKVQFREFSCYL